MQEAGNANSAAPDRISGLGLAAAALLAALLAVGLIEARHLSMMQAALAPAGEVAAVQLVQLDAENQRLNQAWKQALETNATPDDEQRLRQRYADWRASLQGLTALAAEDQAGRSADSLALLRQLQDFRLRADHALAPGDAPSTPAAREALASLQSALAALAPPLAEQARLAPALLQTQAQARRQAMNAHSRLGLGLVAFLALLTLGFAAVALRQVHSLRRRRHQLEALTVNLREARQQAEAASQAKSAFLANMSHEIRTPFHGLMGMLSLLREAGLNARQIDYLRTATESADHLLALLNDILDMSQLESGQLALRPAPLALRGLLRDVEALMRPQAAARALALHLDADPAVPERVLLDATRVRQIVFNLLSNAIKFTDRGAVTLDLRCRSESGGEAGSERLEFIVTDTGPGMDADTLQRLFSRFMQGDSSRQRRHGGSGLGLEISRNLARLMDGDITVRSKISEGSRFVFWVPLRRVAEAGLEMAPTPPPGPAGRPLCVLVAEDHTVNREYLAALLDKQGHSAYFTVNGEEAVQAARERAFDVVLMDLHMPVMDGLEATRAIRSLTEAPRSTVPIVALTADAYPETQEKCMVTGMNDYLTKPVSPQALATCFRRLFGSNQPGGHAAGGGAGGSSLGAAKTDFHDSRALVDPAAMALVLQGMDLQELQRLIDAYLQQGPATVQRLRAAVRDAQPLELRVHAHAAKGAALNLGLSGLASTAQALQGGAAHLPAHEIARLVQHFEQQLQATRDHLGPALAEAARRAAAGPAGSARM